MAGTLGPLKRVTCPAELLGPGLRAGRVGIIPGSVLYAWFSAIYWVIAPCKPAQRLSRIVGSSLLVAG